MNVAFRYKHTINDIIILHHLKFDDYVGHIYQIELEMKDTQDENFRLLHVLT